MTVIPLVQSIVGAHVLSEYYGKEVTPTQYEYMVTRWENIVNDIFKGCVLSREFAEVAYKESVVYENGLRR